VPYDSVCSWVGRYMAKYGTELLPILRVTGRGKTAESSVTSSRLNAASSFASLVRLKKNVPRSLDSSSSAVCPC